MQRLSAALLMFVLGSIVGYQAAEPVLSWLAAPSDSTHLPIEMIATVAASTKLGLSFGALFASAVIAPALIARSSRPAIWSIVYLGFGLLLSATGAAHYRGIYASATDGTPLDAESQLFSVENAPTTWLLLIVSALLLSAGLIHRSAIGFKAKSRLAVSK